MLNRDIPNSVICNALWLASGKVPKQRVPGMSGPKRTWARARQSRRPFVRASLGEAIKWALYQWRTDWTETELVGAAAEVGQRVAALRAKKRRARQRVLSKDRRAILNAHLRAARERLTRGDVLRSADDLLRRNPLPPPMDPAIREDIAGRMGRATRSTVTTRPAGQQRPIYRDGQWFSCDASWQSWLANQEALRRAAVSARVRVFQIAAIAAALQIREAESAIRTYRIQRRASSGTATHTVTMGELARVAADINSRRL